MYVSISVYHLSTKASGGVIIHVLCPWWASLFDVTDETEENKHHKSFERFSEVVKVLGCFINASPTPLKYNLEILWFKWFAEQTGKCAHSHADVRDQHTVCARSLSVPLGKLTGHQSMQLWWHLPFLQSPLTGFQYAAAIHMFFRGHGLLKPYQCTQDHAFPAFQ